MSSGRAPFSRATPRLHACVIAGLLAASGCAHDPVGFDVVLLSVDGTPRALMEEEWGSLSYIPMVSDTLVPMQTDSVTDTKAAHARMLTGYPPEVTTVIDADEFGVIPPGLSLTENLRDTYGSRIVLDYIVNKPTMLGFEEGEAFYNVAGACDYAFDKDEPTESIGGQMLKKLEAPPGKARFAFLHFGGVDKAGHEYVERSDEQRQALHDVDEQIGLIRDALDAEGRLDKTTFYITTDHGFTPGANTHFTDAHETWLVTNDPAVGPTGGLVDQVAWTIRARYDLVMTDPAPEMGALPAD